MRHRHPKGTPMPPCRECGQPISHHASGCATFARTREARRRTGIFGTLALAQQGLRELESRPGLASSLRARISNTILQLELINRGLRK